jgi:8-oxo-dGTP pyrophosphatase MutT (NUDIX family)
VAEFFPELRKKIRNRGQCESLLEEFPNKKSNYFSKQNKQPMLQESAGIFLLDKEHRLLVAHPTKQRPDRWSIPKGRPDAGESHLQTAIRETFEETNIRIPHDVAHHALAHQEGQVQLLITFLVLESENPLLDWGRFDLCCHSMTPGGYPEMEDFQWISLDRAEVELLRTQRKCIPEIRAILAGG